jgi:hypothetical protein
VFAVSISSSDSPVAPSSRLTWEGSPNWMYLRPLTAKFLPMTGGRTEKPRPSSSSSGRWECAMRAISKMTPAVLVSCAQTIAAW